MGCRRLGVAISVCMAMAACTNFGAQQVPVDQFDYNKAIARSMQEQMLLNIVRLHYFEAPVFLAVSSVLTQYAWQGTVGVSRAAGVQHRPRVAGAELCRRHRFGNIQRTTDDHLPSDRGR